jgi:hypothetical protein
MRDIQSSFISHLGDESQVGLPSAGLMNTNEVVRRTFGTKNYERMV